MDQWCAVKDCKLPAVVMWPTVVDPVGLCVPHSPARVTIPAQRDIPVRVMEPVEPSTP